MMMIADDKNDEDDLLTPIATDREHFDTVTWWVLLRLQMTSVCPLKGIRQRRFFLVHLYREDAAFIDLSLSGDMWFGDQCRRRFRCRPFGFRLSIAIDSHYSDITMRSVGRLTKRRTTLRSKCSNVDICDRRMLEMSSNCRSRWCQLKWWNIAERKFTKSNSCASQ